MRAQRFGFPTLNASEHQSLRGVRNEALYSIDVPSFMAITSGCNTQAPTSERCQQTSSLSPKGLLVKWVMVGRRKSAVRGQREPLASFYLFICYFMFFILHIFVFQRALFGVYAHFRFLYSIFINIFTECEPTTGYQHTMLGPKGLWVQMN